MSQWCFFKTISSFKFNRRVRNLFISTTLLIALLCSNYSLSLNSLYFIVNADALSDTEILEADFPEVAAEKPADLVEGDKLDDQVVALNRAEDSSTEDNSDEERIYNLAHDARSELNNIVLRVDDPLVLQKLINEAEANDVYIIELIGDIRLSKALTISKNINVTMRPALPDTKANLIDNAEIPKFVPKSLAKDDAEADKNVENEKNENNSLGENEPDSNVAGDMELSEDNENSKDLAVSDNGISSDAGPNNEAKPEEVDPAGIVSDNGANVEVDNVDSVPVNENLPFVDDVPNLPNALMENSEEIVNELTLDKKVDDDNINTLLDVAEVNNANDTNTELVGEADNTNVNNNANTDSDSNFKDKVANVNSDAEITSDDLADNDTSDENTTTESKTQYPPRILRGEERTTSLIYIKGGSLTLDPDENGNGIILDGEKIETKMHDGIFISIYENSVLTINEAKLINANNIDNNEYSAPVRIFNKGKFILNEGQISDNFNQSTSESSYNHFQSTGAVKIDADGSFIMNGGELSRNSASAGAVLVSDLYGDQNKYPPAIFDFNGGLIANNSANSYLAGGGGIAVSINGKATMNGGTISGNHAAQGGGVFVHDNYVTNFDGVSFVETYNIPYEQYKEHAAAHFTMNAGTITNNAADIGSGPMQQNNGGGICVNSDEVYLNGGTISNNLALNMGGGIYAAIVPYTLRLKNAVITNNSAKVLGAYYYLPSGNGGGVWFCPSGAQSYFSNKGVYIFDNNASNAGSDLFSHAKANRYKYNGKNISADFHHDLIPFDPAGNPIDWYRDNKPRYVKGSREGQKETDLIGIQSVALVAETNYSDSDKQNIIANAGILITGNTAQKGGGIASNAHVTFGEEPERISVSIDKKWLGETSDLDTNKKDKIIVRMMLDGQYYTTYTLSEKNAWRHTFKNIPKGHYVDGVFHEYKITFDEVDEFGNILNGELSNAKTGKDRFSIVIKRVFSKRTFKDNENGNDYEYENPNFNPFFYSNYGWYYADPTATWNSVPGNSIKLHTYLNGEKYGLYELFDASKWSVEIPLPEKSDLPIKVERYYVSNEVREGADKDTPIGGYFDYRYTSYNVYIEGNAKDGYTVKLPFLNINSSKWTNDSGENPDDIGFVMSQVFNTTKSSAKNSFILSNKLKKSLNISKLWEPSITDEEKKEVEIEIYKYRDSRDEAELVKTIKLNLKNEWKTVVTDLDADFKYFIKEKLNDDSDYTASYSEEYRDLKIKIEQFFGYLGSSNPYVNGLANPGDGITLHLTVNGEKKQDIKLTDSNSWKAENIDLGLKVSNKGLKIQYDKQEDGTYYSYGIREANINVEGDVTNGYTIHLPAFQPLFNKDGIYLYHELKVTPVYSGSYVIKANNTRRAKTNIEARKTWQGGENLRPSTYTFRLLRDGIAYGEDKTVNSDQETVTWQNLPVSDHNGRDYVYQVQELNVPQGFVAEQTDNLHITNKYQPPKTNITVHKIWLKDEKEESPTIHLQLYRKTENSDTEEAVGEEIILTNGVTEYEFKDLDAYNNNGQKYDYFVKETQVPDGYEPIESDDSLTLINRRIGEKEYTVRKNWQTYGEDHPALEIELYAKYADGSEVKYGESIVLSAGKEENQEYTWNNLPAFDENGHAIEYYAKEISLEKYSSSSETIENGILFNNERITEPTTTPSTEASTEPSTSVTTLPTKPTEPTATTNETTPTTPAVTVPTTTPQTTTTPTTPNPSTSHSTQLTSETNSEPSQSSTTTKPSVPSTGEQSEKILLLIGILTSTALLLLIRKNKRLKTD